MKAGVKVEVEAEAGMKVEGEAEAGGKVVADFDEAERDFFFFFTSDRSTLFEPFSSSERPNEERSISNRDFMASCSGSTPCRHGISSKAASTVFFTRVCSSCCVVGGDGHTPCPSFAPVVLACVLSSICNISSKLYKTLPNKGLHIIFSCSNNTVPSVKVGRGLPDNFANANSMANLASFRLIMWGLEYTGVINLDLTIQEPKDFSSWVAIVGYFFGFFRILNKIS